MAFFSSFLLIVVLNSVCVSSIPLWTSDDIFPLIRSKEASSAKRAAANSDLRASDGRAYLRVRVHAGRRLAKEGSGINQRIRFINCKTDTLVMQKGSLSRQCHFNMSSIPRDELTLKAEIYVYTPFATPRDKKQNVSVYDADTHQKVGFRSLSRIKPGWSWLPVFSVDKRWLVNSERNKGIYVRLQIDSGPAGVVSKHGYRPSFHPWLLVYTKETMSGSEMLHDLFRSS